MDRSRSQKVTGWLGELSGSVADLGTFLPLVVGVLAVKGFDGAGVLIGFGVFSLIVALVYRRPIPIQPMKAVAALIIVGTLTPAQATVSGLIVGGVLLVLALSGLATRIARLVPMSVIMGIQFGVGAQLALLGGRHIFSQPLFGGAALALLLLLIFTPYRHLGSFVVVVTAATAFLLSGEAPQTSFGLGLHLPAFAIPALSDFEVALTTVALPQLALTLSNAVLATAAIAGDYFPEDKARLSPRNLSLSTGILNLILAPFGALPMCHGSGGLIAQYGFGARAWGAPDRPRGSTSRPSTAARSATGVRKTAAERAAQSWREVEERAQAQAQTATTPPSPPRSPSPPPPPPPPPPSQQQSAGSWPHQQSAEPPAQPTPAGPLLCEVLLVELRDVRDRTRHHAERAAWRRGRGRPEPRFRGRRHPLRRSRSGRSIADKPYFRRAVYPPSAPCPTGPRRAPQPSGSGQNLCARPNRRRRSEWHPWARPGRRRDRRSPGRRGRPGPGTEASRPAVPPVRWTGW